MISLNDLLTWNDLRELNSLTAEMPLSNNLYQELIRLNHLVMEDAHKIHNDNMLKHD